MDVEHRCELDEQAPPRPFPDSHELPDILLDAPDRDVLHLERIRKVFKLLKRNLIEIIINSSLLKE
jgi:hypothetical protein